MAKRNQYSFGKRQREIKKKKKADEKRLRKQAKREGVELDEFGNPILIEEDGEEGEVGEEE